MKTYKTKSLVKGFRLNEELTDDYVAVPKQRLGEDVEVIYRDQAMVITPKDEPATEIVFSDKFGRGEYTLCYFLWKPSVQQLKFI